MKKLILPIVATMGLLSTTQAFSNDFFCNVVPYVGIDAEGRHMGYKKGLGNNLFKKEFAEGNIYTGIKFNDWVGLEIGYRESSRKHTRAANTEGAVELGDAPLPAGAVNYSDNTVQIKSPYINLVGYVPLCNNFQLFGAVGLTRARIQLRYRITGVELDVFPQDVQDRFQRDFKRSKTIFQAQAGAQYLITSCLGLRGYVGFQNTAKFKNISSLTATSTSRASLKNSFLYGLGVFWNFN